MEDDAGKLVYGEDGELFIDYNRCGVPLLEIVTAPELHSDREASDFLEELIGVLRAIGVSDCRMQEGSMRVDINLPCAGRVKTWRSDGNEKSQLPPLSPQAIQGTSPKGRWKYWSRGES